MKTEQPTRESEQQHAEHEPSRPLTMEELESLYEEAKREVELSRADGLVSPVELPSDVSEQLQPHINALERLFKEGS